MNKRQARKAIIRCLLKGIKEGDIECVKGYSSRAVYRIGSYLLVRSEDFTSAHPRDTPYAEAMDLHTKSNDDRCIQWWHNDIWFMPQTWQVDKIHHALEKANYHFVSVETPLYEWVIPCD